MSGNESPLIMVPCQDTLFFLLEQRVSITTGEGAIGVAGVKSIRKDLENAVLLLHLAANQEMAL